MYEHVKDLSEILKNLSVAHKCLSDYFGMGETKEKINTLIEYTTDRMVSEVKHGKMDHVPDKNDE